MGDDRNVGQAGGHESERGLEQGSSYGLETNEDAPIGGFHWHAA